MDFVDFVDSIPPGLLTGWTVYRLHVLPNGPLTSIPGSIEDVITQLSTIISSQRILHGNNLRFDKYLRRLEDDGNKRGHYDRPPRHDEQRPDPRIEGKMRLVLLSLRVDDGTQVDDLS